MSKVFLFPVVLFLFCVVTFIGTSLATILEGHTIIPYISEGGSYAPQSCIFSEALNLACIFLGIIIYTRFRQIQAIMCYHSDINKSTIRLNSIGLWIGFGSCFGLSIVANFQLTNVQTVHYLGALTCFFLGNVYFWIQSHISYNVHPYVGSIQMAHIRFLLSSFSSYFFFTTIITSCELVHLLFPDITECTYLGVSVFSEWIVAFIFCFYLLSFTTEFQKISLDHPRIYLIGYEHITLDA